MADDENHDDPARNRHRQRRGLLKMYYGVGEETGKPTSIDPCDINGAHFQPETYLDKTFKEKTLTELMDKEGDISKQIKALDSDMQTLVYENYNKFISATDTIRKMKHDFKKMEEEMTELEKNMSAITDFSEKISSTLQDKRQQITKLSGVHTLLTKLQFLFELPSRLKKCVEMKQYGLAVRYYTKARDVLHQYSHMPSFQGIHQDCDEIVKELITRLREQLRNPKSTPKQLAECVDLLLQLHEPADELCDEFITQARERLDENIRVLEAQVEFKKQELQPVEASECDSTQEESKHQRPMDFLEFIDCGCNGFLSTVCLVIASYKEQFVERQIGDHVTDPEELERVVSKKLSSFMQTLMGQYFKITEARIELETDTGNNVLLVRALDRFHRRLQAVHKLLPDIGSGRSGANIIARAAHNRVIFYTQSLRQQFAVCLTDTRQALAALPRQTGKDKSHALSDLLTQTSNAILDQIKTVLNYLKAFIGPDITFSVKPYFRGPFCADDVREGLVVDFLKHVLETAKDFCNKVSSPPPALVLLLSRLCTDFHESTITYVLSLTDEQFPVDEELRRGCVRTPVSELVSEARSIAQDLLNHYVKIQGLVISQMIRKSVETRDWINTIEPRNVRAVMKRIVEDVTAIDTQVGQLYEEGARKAHSSDSSKFAYSLSSQAKPSRSQFSYTPSTGFDSSLLSNIQKLFSEKIEIFSPVEFSKVSVLTGVVKIALKTLLECVRLRTFGKYGLQQIQVDTHYLQLYLWRFVSDENLVHVLLDEVVNSAVNRSVESELMESSIVDVICDRG